ncbi:hypothetical protein AAG570_000855 [Ranatra chinensis]|uniref:Uncharacterized protein n=1 Tax=Ranatra chinensis TaxID=642074 RepID=A0ABD0YYB2_9HEMI
MASKRRNVSVEGTKQETTEIGILSGGSDGGVGGRSPNGFSAASSVQCLTALRSLLLRQFSEFLPAATGLVRWPSAPIIRDTAAVVIHTGASTERARTPDTEKKPLKAEI